MNMQEIHEYLKQRASHQGFVIGKQVFHCNEDKVYFLLSRDGSANASVVSLSGMDQFRNNGHQLVDLLESRLANAISTLVHGEAA